MTGLSWPQAMRLAGQSVSVRRPHWEDRPSCILRGGRDITVVSGDGGYILELTEIGLKGCEITPEDLAATDWIPCYRDLMDLVERLELRKRSRSAVALP